MDIKEFVRKFFKNLAVGLITTLASFSSVIFILLSSLGDKVSFQGGLLGHIASSMLIAWFVISVAALPPLMIISLVATFLQLRKGA